MREFLRYRKTTNQITQKSINKPRFIFELMQGPISFLHAYIRQLFRNKSKWSTLSDKIVEISAWCRKFCRRKILSVENFVQYLNRNVRQKSDKFVEISAWCRKFCPKKYFVQRKFCPIRYMKEFGSICLLVFSEYVNLCKKLPFFLQSCDLHQ